MSSFPPAEIPWRPSIESSFHGTCPPLSSSAYASTQSNSKESLGGPQGATSSTQTLSRRSTYTSTHTASPSFPPISISVSSASPPLPSTSSSIAPSPCSNSL